MISERGEGGGGSQKVLLNWKMVGGGGGGGEREKVLLKFEKVGGVGGGGGGCKRFVFINYQKQKVFAPPCFSFGGTVQYIEESNIYLCFVVCRLKRGLVT